MKKITEITEKESRHICNLLGESLDRLIVPKDFGTWEKAKPFIDIHFKKREGKRDGFLRIESDGTVMLLRSNERYEKEEWKTCDSDWMQNLPETVNPLPVIDYLRAEGFEFKY